jgi:hypothetical protein
MGVADGTDYEEGVLGGTAAGVWVSLGGGEAFGGPLNGRFPGIGRRILR